MALPTINPTTTKAWKALQNHYNAIKQFAIKDLFLKEENRADNFKINWEDFYVDFSKNRITEETISLLLEHQSSKT